MAFPRCLQIRWFSHGLGQYCQTWLSSCVGWMVIVSFHPVTRPSLNADGHIGCPHLFHEVCHVASHSLHFVWRSPKQQGTGPPYWWTSFLWLHTVGLLYDFIQCFVDTQMSFWRCSLLLHQHFFHIVFRWIKGLMFWTVDRHPQMWQVCNGLGWCLQPTLDLGLSHLWL